jgi:hypothetical protein
MGCASERYQPRRAEAGVLHTVVREHLDDFLRAAADRADGRVRVGLKRAWREGTTHLRFDPLEFLEKLTALTPRPGAPVDRSCLRASRRRLRGPALCIDGASVAGAIWARAGDGFLGPVAGQSPREGSGNSHAEG